MTQDHSLANNNNNIPRDPSNRKRPTSKEKMRFWSQPINSHVNELINIFYLHNNNTDLYQIIQNSKISVQRWQKSKKERQDEDGDDLTSALSDGTTAPRVGIRLRPRAAVIVRSSSPAARDGVPPESIVAYVIRRSQEPPVCLWVELKLIAGDGALPDQTAASRLRWSPPVIMAEGPRCEERGDEESKEEEEERSYPCSLCHFLNSFFLENGRCI